MERRSEFGSRPVQATEGKVNRVTTSPKIDYSDGSALRSLKPLPRHVEQASERTEEMRRKHALIKRS